MGKRAWQLGKKRDRKPETFNFLGFTHYGGTRRRGYFVMGHKTSKQNLHRKIQEIKEWIKRARNYLPLKDGIVYCLLLISDSWEVVWKRRISPRGWVRSGKRVNSAENED